jgi:hypothetical protein
LGSGWDPREKGIVFASLVAQLRDAARVLGSWSPAAAAWRKWGAGAYFIGGIGFETTRARRKERGIGDDGRFITTDVDAEHEELAGLGSPSGPPSPSPDLEDAKINRI